MSNPSHAFSCSRVSLSAVAPVFFDLRRSPKNVPDRVGTSCVSEVGVIPVESLMGVTAFLGQEARQRRESERPVPAIRSRIF